MDKYQKQAQDLLNSGKLPDFRNIPDARERQKYENAAREEQQRRQQANQQQKKNG
jgi:hypothetical protein